MSWVGPSKSDAISAWTAGSRSAAGTWRVRCRSRGRALGTRFATLCVAAALAFAGCATTAPATLAPAVAEPTSAGSAAPPPQATIAAAPTLPVTSALPIATQAPRPSSAPIGRTEIAAVVSITDGDTIRIDRGQGSEALRYIGINTPEVGDPGADEATAANADLVAGQEVVLERDVSETDQFDRLLRYVWIHDGSTWTFVNLELVMEGVAQAATYPPDVRYVDLFLAAEQTARDAEVGLWAPEPDVTDPPDTGGNCHPSYDPCLPIVDDLDCPDVRALGVAPVRIIGPDVYRLDRDGDGFGCE
jgi:micrococcal nuclease